MRSGKKPMKLTDLTSMSDADRLRFYTRIETETRLLNDQSLRALESGIRYLFLVNAGGAVAVLSFLAANKANREAGPLVALGCFSLGLVFVGVLHAYRAAYFGRRWRTWWDELSRFFADAIPWEDVNSSLAKASKEHWWPYALGYFSGALFVAGALIGFGLLLCVK